MIYHEWFEPVEENMKGYFEGSYGKIRLNGVGVLGIDVKASIWRAFPVLQEQYPTKMKLIEDEDIKPVKKVLSGFRYFRSRWLDMPPYEFPLVKNTEKCDIDSF